MIARILRWLIVSWMALAFARPVAAQETLASARNLYAAAAYDEALGVLNRLRAGNTSIDETRGIEQYRALCLLALGRASEAERSIEQVIAVDPTYQPGEVDASPRVRAVFADVRRRMLPAMAQQRYADAKALFDRREYAAAADAFKRAIALLDDPAAAADRSLADLRTLAAGFVDLSVAAATAPPPPAPAPAPVPASAPSPAMPPAVALPPRIHVAGERGVIPPVVIRQEVPRWQGVVMPNNGLRGVLEVVINEIGYVASATLREPIHRAYDAVLLASTKSWRYRPATLNGQPVKFRKMIQVTLTR